VGGLRRAWQSTALHAVEASPGEGFFFASHLNLIENLKKHNQILPNISFLF
jgi:hypothetical protein